MKTTIIWFLFTTAHIVSTVPVNTVISNSSEDLVTVPRFIKFPDGEGNLHDVDLEAPVDQKLLDEINRNPANNLYLLYTRRNPTFPQMLVNKNDNSIFNSNFNPRVPTVVIVHGWFSNQDSDINSVVTNACLRREDVNVIVMDWSRLANSNYVTATTGVPAVGRGLGQFLAFLNSVTGAHFTQMHLVGFCLGAHVVGYAGRELEGRVARVTGLSPAGPLWNYNSDRLNPNDAIYVEAIHTNSGNTIGGLGIGSDVANADFYVNGGVSQPDCKTNICSHNKSWRYFADTVFYNDIIGTECISSWQITMDICNGTRLHMGNNDLKKWGSGRFRANTKRRYPF
ncbi:hypothetical protein PYW08_002757 [Mythimna loreyi]|uniref:Uncharacterized protein n=1 Tax=Mythimna loreyi TaxID=667449 RepID=A0ACC2QKW4_9NEOP|nr:hypothetical protein PYW08_002757 [Mythimna loreyi]